MTEGWRSSVQVEELGLLRIETYVFYYYSMKRCATLHMTEMFILNHVFQFLPIRIGKGKNFDALLCRRVCGETGSHMLSVRV